MSKIAFLGMGLMGSRMASRLLEADFSVAVWNRTLSACEPLLQQGASVLDLEKIADYAVILICLADDYAVTETVEKIYPFLTTGQIIVDFSSLSVQQTKILAEKVAEKQCTWIDSPVSGGTQGAEQGSLVIFAGGNTDTIQQLQPIYQVLSQRVTIMGDVGAGQATKICNQLIVASSSAVIAEAVALAQKAGVNAELLAPALANGFADSKPFQILSPRMASQVFQPVQWKVQTLSKDLNNAVKLAEQFDLNIPVAERALQQLQQHQQHGYAEQDLATIIYQVTGQPEE
ncbi:MULTISPECIES: NAD(P)-dependent oxidoreductase [unclassified Acinetobacter]|uniref:NAD(P)-dependent oxidoreductase n=1 Tax=unclassified Acinetobacter TaxID=196816 RepID=UPI0035B9D32F